MKQIGILGTGNMASALAEAWTRSGHTVTVGGRSREKADALADRLGPEVNAASPLEVAEKNEVILVAVPWEGLGEILELAAGPQGALRGKTVIDCTNPVDFAVGKLKPVKGSAAELVADLAPGAHVVKALHLFAGQSWLIDGNPFPAPTVAICGDDPTALEITGDLIRDLGGIPAAVGDLDASRQLEEVSGFVMRLVSRGFDPATAVPAVPTG